MAETILDVHNLKKTYGSKTVVKEISFQVKRGEVFGILGPNGAGKTTTLEMIETLRPIDGGQAVLDGLDVAKQPAQVKERIGVQLQSSAFFDYLSLVELLEVFGSLYPRSNPAIKLLEEVQLSQQATAYAKNLSGGQRQRFSIATALVNDPVILFLDEPTTGLDPQARRNLWDLIRVIKKKGITIVLTTHYMEEAELLCDRVAIMDEGRVIALDTPQALVKHLLQQGFKKEVKVEQANLEDVFINLTGKDLRE